MVFMIDETLIICFIFYKNTLIFFQNMPYIEIGGPSELKGDNNSDLSEESLTGDSGRGGSEEDVRNSGLTGNSDHRQLTTF